MQLVAANVCQHLFPCVEMDLQPLEYMLPSRGDGPVLACLAPSIPLTCKMSLLLAAQGETEWR